MEVAGLCAACQRPGALVGCALCGLNVHARCLETGRHAHGGATPPPRGGPGRDLKT